MGNKILNEDIIQTIDDQKELLESYRHKSILVTGATGLIGRILLKTLCKANEKMGLKLTLIALARNPNKVERIFSNIEKDSINFLYQDIRQKLDIDADIDFIFHTAAITQSKILIDQPIEAFQIQVNGTYNILEFSRLKNARVLYLSSMEIYGQPFIHGKSTEKDLGYVDPLIIRNGYPEAKRSCEFLVSAFSQEHHVFGVNARLAQTFGPGVDQADTRVFAQFIRSAMNDQDIVLHTDGSSKGNYCYLQDTISALLLLIVKGESGESYNVVNERTNMTIKEMAELVSNHFGNGNVKIEMDGVKHGYAPKVDLQMSSDKLQALGWKPTYDLEEMFDRTIQSFKEID